jgi:hypothetical protein
MPLPFTRRGIDPDAADFCSRSGASDVSAIDAFVKGVKDLGLWNSMVCWPLRRSQNSGTNTAFSLGGLGTFDGTLVNGPTWGTSGILFDAATNTHITTPLDVIGLRKFTAMVATEQRALVNVSTGDGVISAWGSTASQNYFVVRKSALTNVQGIVRSAGTTRTLSVGSQTADWRVYGWGTQGANTILTASGAQIGTQAFLPEETSSQTLNIGILSTPNNSPYDGTIAWAMFYKDNELTTALQLSVYNLYRNTLGTGLGLPDYDPATIEYAARSGATDLANIDAFVRGVKDLGLWESMVCWPLRSTQNAGTGTTAYSLGGLGAFNGTLTDGPTWGADGMTFDNASAQYISTGFSFDPATLSTGVATIVKPTDSYPTGDSREICGNRQNAAVNFYKNINGTQDIVIFDSVADHNNAAVNSRIGTTFANTRHFAGGFVNSATRQYLNQANATTATATSTGGAITSGSHAFQIGRGGTYSTARTWTGEISVVTLIRRSTITAQDIESLRTLYKQTLGTGLGLP